MLTTEESVVIDKPRQEVFAFFADPDQVTVYSSNISDYEVTSGGNTEIGRTARVVVRVAGVRLEFNDELIAFEEGRRLVTESKDAKIPYVITLTFEEAGAGTRVTWTQETESLGGVFKFADGIVMKMYGRDVRSNLENAKELLEG